MSVSPSATRVSPGDLWKLVAGVLCLQVTFNAERRQGLGVAVALAALSRRVPGAEERRRFLLRHMENFNTNPVLAGPLLGAVARLEERGMRGDAEAAERAQKTKSALEAPLAAVGDAFMWNSLRPSILLWGVIGALMFGLGWLVAVLVLYNAVHLGLRVGGVFWGYRHADRVQELLGGRWLRLGIRLGPLLIGSGVLVASYAAWGWRPGGPEALGIAGMILGWFLGQRGFTRGAVLALGGMIVGLVFSSTL